MPSLCGIPPIRRTRFWMIPTNARTSPAPSGHVGQAPDAWKPLLAPGPGPICASCARAEQASDGPRGKSACPKHAARIGGADCAGAAIMVGGAAAGSAFGAYSAKPMSLSVSTWLRRSCSSSKSSAVSLPIGTSEDLRTTVNLSRCAGRCGGTAASRSSAKAPCPDASRSSSTSIGLGAVCSCSAAAALPGTPKSTTESGTVCARALCSSRCCTLRVVSAPWLAALGVVPR